MKRILSFTFCWILALAGQVADAQLTMTIDPVNDTWWLTGSATGTAEQYINPNLYPGTVQIMWNVSSPINDVAGYRTAWEAESNAQAFTTTLGSPGLDSFVGGYEWTALHEQVGSDGSFSIFVQELVLDSNGISDVFTITGTGAPVSYVNLNPTEGNNSIVDESVYELRFESLIGNTLVLDSGTGSDWGEIVVVAVPETSTYALLLGSLTLGLLLLRRKRK